MMTIGRETKFLRPRGLSDISRLVFVGVHENVGPDRGRGWKVEIVHPLPQLLLTVTNWVL